VRWHVVVEERVGCLVIVDGRTSTFHFRLTAGETFRRPAASNRA
jgi:hypothetical protein